MSSPNVCARCGKCCVVAAGDEWQCFPLGRDDIERIVAYLGSSENDVSFAWSEWSAAEVNTQDFRDVLYKLFPDEINLVNDIFADGTEHVRLGVTDEGKCVFLGAEGCELPRGVRPPHCELYPLWMRGEQHLVADAPECLAVREMRGAAAMYRSLSTDPKTIKRLYAQVRDSLGFPGEVGSGN